MSGYDAEDNLKQKMKNWELIKEAHELHPNNTSRKMLEQAENDLVFAKELIKNMEGDEK